VTGDGFSGADGHGHGDDGATWDARSAGNACSTGHKGASSSPTTDATIIRVVIACEDKYEAQKLASLIFVRNSGSDSGLEDVDHTYIREVVNLIGNEVVISLMDGSSHSILLKDNQEAETFADFVQSAREKVHRLTHAEALQDGRVIIVKQ